MKIKNTEGLKVSEIKQLVQQGAKFVIFPYTISFILMTLKRNSDIYFIRPNEGSFKYSFKYVLLNLFVGWWGIPWGPIYTIGAIYKHIIGGNDVTKLTLDQLTLTDPEGNRSNYNVPTGNTNISDSTTENTNNGYNVSGNMSVNNSRP